MERCVVCGGGLPEVSVLMRDPFCSRACSQEHHGTGTKAERERDSRQRLDRQLESGTDAASLELRRVLVDERTSLIAEGRFWDAYLEAYAAYLVAHKEPVHTPTVTWFSYRSSGQIMREFHEEDETYERDARPGQRDVKPHPFSTDTRFVTEHGDRLGRILSNALTKRNHVPTTVEIDGRYAYVHEQGADYALRFYVPAEAYDALALHEEYGGDGFVIELLPSDDAELTGA